MPCCGFARGFPELGYATPISSDEEGNAFGRPFVEDEGNVDDEEMAYKESLVDEGGRVDEQGQAEEEAKLDDQNNVNGLNTDPIKSELRPEWRITGASTGVDLDVQSPLTLDKFLGAAGKVLHLRKDDTWGALRGWFISGDSMRVFTMPQKMTNCGPPDFGGLRHIWECPGGYCDSIEKAYPVGEQRLIVVARDYVDETWFFSAKTKKKFVLEWNKVDDLVPMFYKIAKYILGEDKIEGPGMAVGLEFHNVLQKRNDFAYIHKGMSKEHIEHTLHILSKHDISLFAITGRQLDYLVDEIEANVGLSEIDHVDAIGHARTRSLKLFSGPQLDDGRNFNQGLMGMLAEYEANMGTPDGQDVEEPAPEKPDPEKPDLEKPGKTSAVDPKQKRTQAQQLKRQKDQLERDTEENKQYELYKKRKLEEKKEDEKLVATYKAEKRLKSENRKARVAEEIGEYDEETLKAIGKDYREEDREEDVRDAQRVASFYPYPHKLQDKGKKVSEALNSLAMEDRETSLKRFGTSKPPRPTTFVSKLPKRVNVSGLPPLRSAVFRGQYEKATADFLRRPRDSAKPRPRRHTPEKPKTLGQPEFISKTKSNPALGPNLFGLEKTPTQPISRNLAPPTNSWTLEIEKKFIPSTIPPKAPAPLPVRQSPSERARRQTQASVKSLSDYIKIQRKYFPAKDGRTEGNGPSTWGSRTSRYREFPHTVTGKKRKPPGHDSGTPAGSTKRRRPTDDIDTSYTYKSPETTSEESSLELLPPGDERPVQKTRNKRPHSSTKAKLVPDKTTSDSDVESPRTVTGKKKKSPGHDSKTPNSSTNRKKTAYATDTSYTYTSPKITSEESSLELTTSNEEIMVDKPHNKRPLSSKKVNFEPDETSDSDAVVLAKKNRRTSKKGTSSKKDDTTSDGESSATRRKRRPAKTIDTSYRYLSPEITSDESSPELKKPKWKGRTYEDFKALYKIRNKRSPPGGKDKFTESELVELEVEEGTDAPSVQLLSEQEGRESDVAPKKTARRVTGINPKVVIPREEQFHASRYLTVPQSSEGRKRRSRGPSPSESRAGDARRRSEAGL